MLNVCPPSVCWILTAAVSYFLGGANGAILISRIFYHDDVRSHGSGNAGLTNFYRNYGSRFLAGVLAVDLLKMAAAVFLGRLFLRGFPELRISVTYFAGFFCILGHIFPALESFRGGKGVLTCGALTILLDWRIAVAAWGVFLALLLLTRYVSLSSMAAAAAFALSGALVFRTPIECFFSVLIALFVVWSHRSNLRRLLSGTESRFSLHRSPPEEKT